MLYSGWDGKSWRTLTANAASISGPWSKGGVVLAPEGGAEGSYIAANGSVQGRQYWYQTGSPPFIRLARQDPDGAWVRVPGALLGPGPRGSWDERGVGDPYVIQPVAGGRYFMFFLGQDRARRQRLGVAESIDGVTWTKYLGNPILDLGQPGSFDEIGLGEPAVWQQAGKWWMLYTGRDRKEWRRTGLAVSADGVHWSRDGERPLLDVGDGWNSRVVCDPEVQKLSDGRVRVWFGGGDRPEPAENLHGQIGTGVLRPEPVN